MSPLVGDEEEENIAERVKLNPQKRKKRRNRNQKI